MIKKAVLTLTLTPFLMVFSDYSFASSSSCPVMSMYDPTTNKTYAAGRITAVVDRTRIQYTSTFYFRTNPSISCLLGENDPRYSQSLRDDPYSILVKSDEECQSTKPTFINFSSYDEASVSSVSSGLCQFNLSGPIIETANGDFSVYVSSAESTGNPYQSPSDEDLDFPTSDDLSVPDYLSSLPGGCSDSSSCLLIGDDAYLVDWESAPDWFEYVGSDGNTYSKPSSGDGDTGGDTGGGDPTDPTNPTDPTDPGGNDGGDYGGSDGGNDSGDGSGGSSGGGGSTVPEFEFDESGIIEAIGSAGQSNRNAINALSNDVTGSINNQTNELNNATSAQTDALSGALNTQTDALTNSLDSQTDNVTSALDDQTGTLTGALDALGTSIVDAINSLGSSSDEGEGEGGLWDGLIDSLAGLFGSGTGEAADSFASGLEETTSDAAFDEFDQQGYAEGLFDTYETEQLGLLEERVQALLDTVDTTLAPYRNLVSRLIPDIPTATCTPIVFGSGHMSFTIDCEGFNLLKAMLAWVLYVFTAYTIVSTIFSYRSSAQQGA